MDRDLVERARSGDQQAFAGGRSESRDWPVTMDEHPGVLFVYHSDAQAFVLVDDRMYVVAAWRPESQRYVEAFLSTMTLHPGGPAPASN